MVESPLGLSNVRRFGHAQYEIGLSAAVVSCSGGLAIKFR